MKKVSAVLLILAVLNPLCCCFAFSQGHAVDNKPMAADHACCSTSSEAPEQNDEQKDASNCEHEDARESVIPANAHISLPFVLLAAQTPFIGESLDSEYRFSPIATSNRTLEAKQSVPRWVGIQTDCVRRL